MGKSGEIERETGQIESGGEGDRGKRKKRVSLSEVLYISCKGDLHWGLNP